jgi:SAM-dependent methyltransferase
VTVFGAGYAAAYDALYQDKDYEAECDLLERLAREHGDGSTQRVLDLGCGTGGHAIVLARRGYEVVGVDRSEEMLALARRKAAGTTAAFRQGDIRSVALGERFDLVAIMFAVLGYLGGDDDVRAALATARRHLRPGGLLVCDVWYEPAVVAQRPSERVREVEVPGGRILRRSSGELDEERRTCTVRFHVVEERDGDRRETEEEHVMRYFSRADLERLTAEAGLDLVRLGAFPDADREPDGTTWNVVAVARAA